MYNHDLLPNTYSNATLKLAATWLNRCTVNHASCKSTRNNVRYHPARLLHLEFPEDAPIIRLIETNDSMSDCAYIALSHCWDGAIPTVLNEGNLDVLKSGIGLEDLPRTFRDAVSVARFLGARYLWIDSLCIIQDSYLDWEREASRMKDVYRNALLTIAATGARASSVGCFFEREVDLVRPVVVFVDWLGVDQGIYNVWDSQIWQDNIIKAPLNERAWVVQERLLSPCILHSGQDQVAWESQEVGACETFAYEIPENLELFGGIYSKSLLKDTGADFVDLHWEEIAETYSRGRLTQEGDKCIALIQHLCWTTNVFENQERQASATRSSKYRAPSWSWLSIDSSIEFYFRATSSHDKDNIMLEVIEVEIQNTGPNKLGPIKSGYILGRGVLKSAKWVHRAGQRDRTLTFEGQVIDHGQFWNFMHSQVIMDVGHSETCEDVLCLPVLSHETPRNRFKNWEYVGLILVPTGDRDNEYRRVGCFQLGWEYGEFLLKENGCDGIQSDLQQHSFTII